MGASGNRAVEQTLPRHGEMVRNSGSYETEKSWCDLAATIDIGWLELGVGARKNQGFEKDENEACYGVKC